MKHGKAMGPDGIPVEVWTSLGEEGVDMLLDLLQKIFEQEKMPEEWRDTYLRKKEIASNSKITEASRLSENNTRIRISFGTATSGSGYAYWSRHDCTSIIFYHAD